MRYAQDMARLVGSVAALTAAGPAPAPTLLATERAAVLTARDAVVAELRGLSGALLRLGPGSVRSELRLIAVSPAHALYLALADLPPAAGDDRMPLLDALAADGGPLTRGWQDAARAAVTLEAYHHALTEKLTATDAWIAVRDVAEVAAALPYLDADLVAALPVGDAARAVLLEPAAHGLVRLAAEQLRGQTADLPSWIVNVVRPEQPRVRPVRTVGELPNATRHLAALVAGRGADLTALEARAVARALTEGVDLTTRVLTAAPNGEPAAALAATGQLSGALSGLQQIVHGQLATLTPPEPAVLFLAHQIHERLRVVTRLVDQLQHETSPRSATDGLRRVAATMSQWADEAISAATDLRDSLHAAATGGRLLMPREDLPRGANGRYLWVSVPPKTAGTHPVVAAATHAAAALSAGREQLAPVVGAFPRGDRAATAPRRGALTSAARDQLRVAVRRRIPGELPPPPRPRHPASLPDLGVTRLSLGG